MIENICGSNVDTVSVGLAILYNGQRNDGDVILFKDLLGKITGTIGKNFNIHNKPPE